MSDEKDWAETDKMMLERQDRLEQDERAAEDAANDTIRKMQQEEMAAVAEDDEKEEEHALPEPESSMVIVPPFSALMGPAGCGKSFQIRQEAAQDQSVLLTSTTGIAAMNLGGTTINSALGYYDYPDMESQYVKGWLTGRLRRLARSGVRVLALDEVSMLDGRQLTLICKAIDEVNKVEKFEDYEPLQHEPDWYYERGLEPPSYLSLRLVGDFCQLPPVKAPFAFESEMWPRFDANTTVLTKIMRQSDAEFIEALRAARKGDGRKALDFFEPLMVKHVEADFPGPTILAKNDEVDRMNDLRLSALPGERIEFKADRWGKERGEWRQIPETLALKEGARVMVLSNKRFMDPETGQPTRRFEYVNGDIGVIVGVQTITDKDKEGNETKLLLGAQVEIERGDGIKRLVMVEQVLRQNLKPLEPGRMEELVREQKAHLIKHQKDPFTGRMRAEWEIIGEVAYMPLRLAYATTVHKSQGLSLSMVQVSLSNPFFSNPGSVYVALSRARAAEGLRLVCVSPEQFVMRCKADPKVARFQ